MKKNKQDILWILQHNKNDSPEVIYDTIKDICEKSVFDEALKEFEETKKYDDIDIEIPMQTKQFREFSAEVKDLGEGVIEAIVASDALDRHGEVLDIKGLDLKEYKKNPIVAYMHRYDELPVAKALTLRKTSDGKLISKMQFAIDEYPFARQVYKLYKAGYMNAFSIGFMPEEMDGNKYTKSRMLEYSAVLIPANAEALVTAKTKGMDVDLIAQKANIVVKGGDRMKLTKLQIKDMLKGNPALSFDSIKDLADEKDFNDAKAELEAEAKAIADNANKDDLTKKLDALTQSVTAIAETVKSFDKPVTKDINTVGNTATPTSDNMPKEDKLKLWVEGMVTRDFSKYRDAVKKDAMSTTNTSDTMPPTEFIAEVMRLEEDYGVARRFARMRRTTKTSITGIYGDGDVAIYETAELGEKKGTKVTYLPFTMTLRKFAAIAPVSDELLEDSAIDIWNDLTQRFARAYAKKEDELVFTDSASGIFSVSGTELVPVTGDSFEDVTADDLNRMQYRIPTAAAANARYWLHRELLGVIQRLKDAEDRYIWQPSMGGGAPATIWGKPYELVEALPNLAADSADAPFIAFGDLKNVLLVERTQLQAKIFDTGIVEDADEEDVNLLTQDAQALRVVKRFNAKPLFPRAFSLLTTGVGNS